ncbi:acetyl-CoA carboxylase carboxyltransferase subunit alpha [Peptoniphilus stercorisuis]|uniref:Acetyl-coenzyme A carboxylase carboxyl transferase subunit alpha n=1 Tax=Peptoniphilus stercorisuis TaxID=1436965 RepID=A0ABS4KBF6_9FIRM|nr:acetyl-CoA carboxylase carboxyltransferase subunit alpha [Peptoniphilus stercorisuis]MBP2024675.1 acetyl-CoA carboxylase carboxyl transferase subunit alpha [Peptoniphilus stercorisuis]
MIENILKDLIREEKLYKKDNRDFKIYKENKLKNEKKNLTMRDRVYLSRYENRPKARDFIKNIIKGPIYFHGDRYYSDDKAVIGGIGKINNTVVTFIGIDKGKDLEDSILKNFGMAHPEGYRKAVRLMKEAEKFNRPIITFIDTPGAYPGIGAEERGQSSAIANSIYEMTYLKVPIISVITGEGCSGGAIGLCVSDYLIMMENATYSVLSPEGFASILWKDSKKSSEAIEIMKISAKDLYDYDICDEIIEEDLALNIYDFKENFTRLKNSLLESINRLKNTEEELLLRNRREKFMRY